MRTKIVRIGNSQGVRIPKALLEEVGMDGEVELTLEDGRIVIEPVRHPRAGWAEEARLMVERGEDGLLDEPTPTEFDEHEWTWE